MQSDMTAFNVTLFTMRADDIIGNQNEIEQTTEWFKIYMVEYCEIHKVVNIDMVFDSKQFNRVTRLS